MQHVVFTPPPGAVRRAFRRGVVQSLPFLLVLIPFATLFGVVATNAGLDIAQTLGFSALVLAGASQFTAVTLLSDHAPVLVILASALAVNMRMAMYSASLIPWIGRASVMQRALVAYLLVDQTYAMAINEYESRPHLTVPERLAFFLGCSLVCCPPWVAVTYIGATAGNMIPASWPLDFAIPITFLAMIAPMLRTPGHFAAAGVAVAASLALAGLPSGAGMLIAAPLGMAAGALVETRWPSFSSRQGGAA